MMWAHPLVMVVLLGLFGLLLVWWVPKVFRGLRGVWRRLRGWRAARDV
jgi:hypothetical protein